MRGLLMAAVVGFLALPLLAEDARPTASEPRLSVALLDADRTPLGGLLEAELLGNTEFRWVERSEIDKLLSEQRLQSLLLPDAGAARRQIGSLIRADRLILLRAREIEQQPYLELAIAETAQGVRLLSRLVPLKGQQAAALATELARQIQTNLKKQRVAIRAIYSVPSFVSQDLLFAHDGLQSAYAALIAERLTEQPGSAVVELAEAEALVREQQLGGAEKVDRPAPYLVIGEYRNTGKGEARRISLAVALRQGTRELASHRTELRPEEAAAYLSRQADDFSKRALGKAALPPDAQAEARQLAQRAHEFEKVGQWEEALPLLRAALLLDAENQEVRLKLIEVAVKLYGKHAVMRDSRLREMQHKFGYCFLVLDEGERYLERGGLPTELLNQSIGMQWFFPHPEYSAEIRDYIQQTGQRRREWCDRIGRQLLAKGHYAAVRYFHASLIALPSEERFLRRLQLMEEFQELPNSDQLLRDLATMSVGVRELVVVKGGDDFVAKLVSSKFEKLRALGLKLQAEVQAEKARLAADQKPSQTPAVKLKNLPFFDWYDENGPRGKLAHPEFIGSVSPGIDVVAFGPALFFMREPGKLKRVWFFNDRETYIARWSDKGAASAVCFDGRFVWATVRSTKATSRLLVVDPTNDKTWLIDSSHGLPTEKREGAALLYALESLAVAPLAPGKIFVAGSVGGVTPRTWLAIVTFDPAQGPTIDVIHEARELRDPKQREQWRSPDLAFMASTVYTLAEPKGDDLSHKRILVMRPDAAESNQQHPLIVDPATRTIEVMQAGIPISARGQGSVLHEGALLFVAGNHQTNEVSLCRLPFPGTTVETVAKIPREGYPLVFQDRLHVIGKQWWTGSLSGDDLKSVGECSWGYIHMSSHVSENKQYGPALNLQYVATSQHYGVLALHGGGIQNGLVLSQVQLDN